MKIDTVKLQQSGVGWVVNGTDHVPNDPSNMDTKAVLEYIADGGFVSPADPIPSPPTVEEAIERLPPLWKATLEAYIEQQPRNRRAIINNIKRHLK